MQIYLFTKIMNAKIYPEWKWSNGIPYEKSNRIKPCENIQEEQPKKEEPKKEEPKKEDLNKRVTPKN